MDDEFEDLYDSGLFCRHFEDPADCTRVCMCGHGCEQHSFIDSDCFLCDCPQWEEKE